MASQILQSKAGISLIQQTELKYFKNGRANMHVATSYHVECVQVHACRYHMTNKAEAKKYFNSLVKNLKADKVSA